MVVVPPYLGRGWKNGIQNKVPHREKREQEKQKGERGEMRQKEENSALRHYYQSLHAHKLRTALLPVLLYPRV